MAIPFEVGSRLDEGQRISPESSASSLHVVGPSPAQSTAPRMLSEYMLSWWQPHNTSRSRREDAVRAALPFYRWFSAEDYTTAVSCCEAGETAALARKDDICSFFQSALISLYHHGRALEVAAALPHIIEPVTLPQIPETIGAKKNRLLRRITSLTTADTVPVSALPAVTTAVATAPPDHLIFVEYLQRRVVRDPLIYAVYGNWYVELAKWD